MELTREHIHRAALAGACVESLEGLRVGVVFSSMPAADREWAESVVLPQERVAAWGDAAASGLPLAWIDGDGYGYGYGDGYGYGYGDGSGYGYGYGDGSGSGYGDGDGSGYGA